MLRHKAHRYRALRTTYSHYIVLFLVNNLHKVSSNDKEKQKQDYKKVVLKFYPVHQCMAIFLHTRRGAVKCRNVFFCIIQLPFFFIIIDPFAKPFSTVSHGLLDTTPAWFTAGGTLPLVIRARHNCKKVKLQPVNSSTHTQAHMNTSTVKLTFSSCCHGNVVRNWEVSDNTR